MDDRISTVIADDPDHEKVFVEIYIDDKLFARISQERSPEELDLELPRLAAPEGVVIRQVPLKVFQRAVELAIANLIPADE